jgi:hypothetical protein
MKIFKVYVVWRAVLRLLAPLALAVVFVHAVGII